MRNLANEVLDRYPRVDICINNAGAMYSLRSVWFMSHRLREAMLKGQLPRWVATVSSSVVEIDETIYGRADTHPKGRGPFEFKITNSAHKNVILSLVERGGQVRSYHVARSTVGEVIPLVQANISHEAAVMTDKAALSRARLRRHFASHDAVDHSKSEYARYEEVRHHG